MKLFPIIYYAFENPEISKNTIILDGCEKFLSEKCFKHWAINMMRRNPKIMDCAYVMNENPDEIRFLMSPNHKHKC